MATELSAELRTTKGGTTAKNLCKTEMIPAILYGKGIENKNISVKRIDVEKVLKSKHGSNTLIDLKLNGDKSYTTLIKDMQGNVITRALTHVDFWHIKPDQEVEVEVVTHLTGKAPGVTAGGILEHVSHNITLWCKANAIPEDIKVDISHLELNKNIHLSDIKLPEGTRVRTGYNPTIVAVVEEKAIVEETPVAAAADGTAAPAVGADGKPVAAAAVGKDGKPVAAAAAVGKDGKPVAAAPAAAGKDAKGAAPAAAPAKGKK